MSYFSAIAAASNRILIPSVAKRKVYSSVRNIEETKYDNRYKKLCIINSSC